MQLSRRISARNANQIRAAIFVGRRIFLSPLAWRALATALILFLLVLYLRLAPATIYAQTPTQPTPSVQPRFPAPTRAIYLPIARTTQPATRRIPRHPISRARLFPHNTP